MKLLPILALALFSIAAQSSNDRWLLITASNTTKIYCKPSTIKILPDGNVRAWIKDTPRIIQNSVASRQSLYELDCNHRLARVISLVTYNDAGSVLNSTEVPDRLLPDYPFERVVPDSIGDDILNFACDQR